MNAPQPPGDLAPLATRLAQALADRSARVAYGVSGAAIGRFTAAAAAAGLRVVHPRHESGAGFMATEHSLASGEPTVVFATSGPGLSNALTGLVAAAWEGAHVVAVVGSTPRERAGRFPFQRTGRAQVELGPWLPSDVASSVHVPIDADSLRAAIDQLDENLRHPNGSLSVLLLPSDRQTVPCRPIPPPTPLLLRPTDVGSVLEALRGQRVLCWVGHGARHAVVELKAFVEAANAVVVVTPRGKGVFDEHDPRCLGVLGLGGARGVAERVRRAAPDVALVLGARLSEFTSWWDDRLIPRRGFVHVGPQARGDAFPGAHHVEVDADVARVLRAWTPRVRTEPVPPQDDPTPERFESGADGLHPGDVMTSLQRLVDQGVPVISEAGNAFAWATRVLRCRTPIYRVSPDFGAMGQASAGVVGLALGRRGKAVAVLGDGAMLMNTELSTAVQERADAVWVVLNDAAYGMIAHGMQAIGLPPVATAIPRVDFVAFARAQGADGVAVTDRAGLDDALARAAEVDGPFVIDVRIDPHVPPPFGARNDALEQTEEASWRG